jgi:capsular exopolysaccharide synthesis family protein
MSRVEEALRRAAAGIVADPASTPQRSNDRSIVVELGSAPLALGDYPIELGDYPIEDEPSERASERVSERASERSSERAQAAVPRELPLNPIAAPRAGTPRPLSRLGEFVEGKVVVDAETSPVSVEQYRRLATTLHQMQQQSGLKTLIISSARPRDGKTLTSTNLALTLSESFKRRVLLVDADLRRPSIHEVFRLPNAHGLADGLRSEAAGNLPLIEVTPKLTVLPAGTPDNSPMAGETSERMRTVLKEASSRFDWILLDTPPIGLISDASLLSHLVDGVLLVIGAGTTDYAAVKRTVTELGSDRIVGVILNRVAGDASSDDYYQQYYYSASDSESAGSQA